MRLARTRRHIPCQIQRRRRGLPRKPSPLQVPARQWNVYRLCPSLSDARPSYKYTIPATADVRMQADAPHGASRARPLAPSHVHNPPRALAGRDV